MRLSPLPSCTFLIGYVLDDMATDGRDMFLSWIWTLDCVLLSFVQGRFERNSRNASGTGRNVPACCSCHVYLLQYDVPKVLKKVPSTDPCHCTGSIAYT